MNRFTNWPRAVLVAAVMTALSLRAPAAPPHVLRQSETGAATYRGTWTWDDSRKVYVARWENGAEATLRVVRSDGRDMEIIRTDTAGGLTARYLGKKAGDTVRGTVEWTVGGKTWAGTWEGKLETAHTFGAVLTPDQANEVFKAMASMQDIAFKYPVDGCHARAYLMIQRMELMRVRAAKVWAFAPPGQTMEFRTPNHPSGRVRWGWHVAPTVRVRFPDGDRDVVIDPSMFDRPATVEYWRDAMRCPDGISPWISKTRIGEPPIDATGRRCAGTGYLPWPGPPDLEADVRRAMREGFDVLNGRLPWPR
jgi:hypothetical protein